jgi:hypothetical protein
MHDVLDLLDFVEVHGLQRQVQGVQYSLRLLLPPGSPLNAVLEREGRLGAFDEERLTYTWASLDPRVDALQSRISAIVEGAVGEVCDCGDADCAPAAEDALMTFERVRAEAYRAVGRPVPPRRGPEPPPIAPGLSEAWYCCAEPTNQQLAPILLEA